jgi:predicted phage terminase large subunit-like protein
VAIEDVQYQRVLIQKLAAETSLNVRGVKPISDKVSRFAPLEGRYEMGQVYHSRGLPPEFESELLSFPIGSHDDMVDALAYAWQGLDIMPREIPKLAFAGQFVQPAWK